MKRMVVKAERYRNGLEDGFDNIGGQFINTVDGKRYISTSDFIVTCVDNTKFILSENLFDLTFLKINNEIKMDSCPFCKTPFDKLYTCIGNCIEDCNCNIYE